MFQVESKLHPEKRTIKKSARLFRRRSRRLRKLVNRSSPSRHGAKTWVTLWSRDMGDTFFVKEAVFRGYAVEHSIEGWGAMALGAGIASEGKVGWSLVPKFWHQPQNGVQVAATFFGGWTARVAGSLAATQSSAAPMGWPLVGALEAI